MNTYCLTAGQSISDDLEWTGPVIEANVGQFERIISDDDYGARVTDDPLGIFMRYAVVIG